jgi:hypothetical protein
VSLASRHTGHPKDAFWVSTPSGNIADGQLESVFAWAKAADGGIDGCAWIIFRSLDQTPYGWTPLNNPPGCWHSTTAWDKAHTDLGSPYLPAPSAAR